MIKVSVIVPMYNAASYLERCISSLFNQDLPDHEFELILVNDGSPDNSLEIAQKLTKDKTNVNIISQLNKGLGGARNTGIDHANGQYILFVDADDYLLQNKIGLLYEQAYKNQLDILEFGAEGVSSSGARIYRNSKTGLNKPVSGPDYLASINYMNSACNKIYSTHLLQAHKLRFLERVFIEDIEFNTRVFFYAKRVLAIPEVCAHFVNTPGSITRASSQTKQYKMIDDMLEVITIIRDFVKNHYPANSPALPRLQKRISNLTISLLNRSMRNAGNLAKQKEIIKKLKSINLYPVKYNTDTLNKDIYKLVANNNIVYLWICRIHNFTNKNLK